MKLSYQYMTIFFTFPPTSNHLHLLQVENCGSNSRLVVDEDDNEKFRLERVKHHETWDVYVKMTSGKWLFNIYFSGDRQPPPPPPWFWYGCVHEGWHVESDCNCLIFIFAGDRPWFLYGCVRGEWHVENDGFDMAVYIDSDKWKVIV